MILEVIIGIGIVYFIGRAMGFEIKATKIKTNNKGRPLKQDDADEKTISLRKKRREYMREYQRRRKESA